MNGKQGLILAVLLAITAAAGYLWWMQRTETETAPVVVAAETAAQQGSIASPAAEAEPAIEHPLEATPAEPLPAVDDSDSVIGNAIARLIGDMQWRAFFYPDGLVRRIVATVDNLPRHDAPVKMWPVHPVGSWFDTVAAGDDFIIGPNNAARYARYVDLVKAVDATKLAAVYRRLYPLFQQAYRDLGFPKGYFNDRVVIAIDDLLATPEIAEPLRLRQDKVRYQFADPDLDGRSAGQKIMLRIGPENARIVKAKLREFRRAIG